MSDEFKDTYYTVHFKDDHETIMGSITSEQMLKDMIELSKKLIGETGHVQLPNSKTNSIHFIDASTIRMITMKAVPSKYFQY